MTDTSESLRIMDSMAGFGLILVIVIIVAALIAMFMTRKSEREERDNWK